MIEERAAWRSRFGFYIASFGTAFGLGNLWRFPYVAVDYGGGAFVFLYVLLAFFIGVPLMVGEICLGKYLFNKGMGLDEFIDKHIKLGVFKKLLWLPYIVSFLVFCYYSILSGWTLHLLIQTASDIITQHSFIGDMDFVVLKSSKSLQIMLASLHLLIVLFISAKGLKVGIEKWLSFIMPFFIVFIFYIAFKIIKNTDVFQAIKYMVYPNFHQLTPKSLSYALGHVLFSMSLGFCTIVTLGYYLPRYSSSGTAGVRIALLDTLISICIGVVLFPVIFSSDYNGAMSEALFRAFPLFIQRTSISLFFALGFYLCILVASINVSISLTETLLYRINDSFKLTRSTSAKVLFVITMVFISLIVWIDSSLYTLSFIEILDDILINFILPFSAIGLSYITLQYVDTAFLKKEFDVDEKIENKKIYFFWRAFLYFIVPAIYVIGVFLRLRS